MLYQNRVWVIAEIESAEELAKILTQYTWCCCNGFRHGGYLFVNDSTSGDGAQEYAILRQQEDEWVQVESVTFSWMSTEKGLEIISQVLAGQFNDASYYSIKIDQIQTPEEHGRCYLCA